MNKTVLICTVGGSHEPIITALRQTKPDHVCFICSGRDPATGRPGSATQITGPGSIIKKHPADDKPTLPNIPTQAGLQADQYEVVEVAADDLGAAFHTIRTTLAKLVQRFPDGNFLADYTGGTKTMTAALVTAAFESDNIELQLVTGSRADLIKVRSGMESATPVNVERIRLERLMAPYIAAWQRYAYAEAAAGLARLTPPHDADLAARLRRLRDLSRAFDAWDRFDHSTAFNLLDAYRPAIGQTLAPLLNSVKALSTESSKQEPMRLFDLWRNAQRRAEQGRYDDAVARVYRLLEWTAQWLLRVHAGVDTSDIPADRLGPNTVLTPNSKGKYQVGLQAAWDLIGQWRIGEADDFVKNQRQRMLDLLAIRNKSIFAHGFDPITETEWNKWKDWMETAFLPMLLQETAKLKLATLPPQLPTNLNHPGT